MGFLSGALGIAGGLLGLSQQKKEQKSADKYNNASIDIQRQQLLEAQKRREDYDKNYKPIEDQFLASIKKGVDPNLEQVTSDVIGDVNTKFAGEESARLRQMGRLGVNPNSGRADAMGRQLSLSRGLALAGGINNARRTEIKRAEDLTYARQNDAVQIGTNKLNNAQSNVSSAANSLSQTYANKATQAQTNASNAANGWADLGSTVYQAWDQYKNQPAKTTVGTGVWM